MTESLKTILMSALTTKATPADTDTMIVAEGNVLKKSTIAQLVTFLKEKLGINALNTKLNGWMIKQYKYDISTSSGYLGTTSSIALDGYKPVCVAGYTISNSSWYTLTSMWIDYSTEKITVAGRHIMGTQTTVEKLAVYVNVLYVPV